MKEGLSALHADRGVDGVIIHLFAGVGHWALGQGNVRSPIKTTKLFHGLCIQSKAGHALPGMGEVP